MEERARDETGMGHRSTFILNEIGPVARAERGKGGGVGVGASVWRQEKEGEGALCSGWQRGQLEAAPGRRGYCTNRGEWSGTADAVRERLTGGAGWQRGLVVSGGVRERVRESGAAR
jgi:hypothetical protein